MPIAPLLLIDGMVGFRLSSGLAILNLTLVRGELQGDKVLTTITPVVDLAMTIPVLRNLMATMSAELDAAETKAQLTPHPTQQ